MKLYTLHNASRELARWRQALRPAGNRDARSAGAPADSDFPVTQWPTTEWSDTLPAAVVWPASDDPRPGSHR